MARYDRRGPEAQSYRWVYKTARWQKLRAVQLSTYPKCATCEKQGKIITATVCDHIEPHRGDMNKIWNGPFQSLCKSCHDRIKQRFERNGYADTIDQSGWPTDKNHPANKELTARGWVKSR